MTSEERIVKSLKHKEPDRVPFDLGSTGDTGISIKAYKNLLSYLGIHKEKIPILDMVQQLALVDEDFLQRFKVDTRGLFLNPPANWVPRIEADEEYEYFVDYWGIKWRKPLKRGYYYDMVGHPLAGSISKKDIDDYPWPDLCDPVMIKGLRRNAKQLRSKKNNPAVVLQGVEAGFFEISLWMRGFTNFYMDLASNPSLACYLMDKAIEMSMENWEFVLKEVGEYTLVVRWDDDLGSQDNLLISPDMYRRYIKPRQKRLFAFIKKIAPKPTYLFYHTCGSIYEIIPDLIEVGVDILNPVQVSAARMNTAKLKRKFGKDLTFWGGGIDTQNVLPYGTPKQVREEVKRRINDLAPGGGFVFNTVHNIQADVPPQNIMAMWETLQKYGRY